MELSGYTQENFEETFALSGQDVNEENLEKVKMLLKLFSKSSQKFNQKVKFLSQLVFKNIMLKTQIQEIYFIQES